MLNCSIKRKGERLEVHDGAQATLVELEDVDSELETLLLHWDEVSEAILALVNVLADVRRDRRRELAQARAAIARAMGSFTSHADEPTPTANLAMAPPLLSDDGTRLIDPTTGRTLATLHNATPQGRACLLQGVALFAALVRLAAAANDDRPGVELEEALAAARAALGRSGE